MRWLKRITFTLLITILLLIVGGGVVFYIKTAPYRQLSNSWAFKKTNESTIGDLGGIPVFIPEPFANFVEYEGDPHFLKPRTEPAPKRTYQSKLKDFGFYFRYPDMAGLTDTTRSEKKQSTIYTTMWMRAGVNVDVKPFYNDDFSLNRISHGDLTFKWDSVHSKNDSPEIWKNKHGYQQSPNTLYGLTVFEVYGYNDAKRNQIPGNGPLDANIYYHINTQGQIDSYIRCNNIQHAAAQCSHQFIVKGLKNTMVGVDYRIGFLSQWKEIQTKVSALILSFAVKNKSTQP